MVNDYNSIDDETRPVSEGSETVNTDFEDRPGNDFEDDDDEEIQMNDDGDVEVRLNKGNFDDEDDDDGDTTAFENTDTDTDDSEISAKDGNRNDYAAHNDPAEEIPAEVPEVKIYHARRFSPDTFQSTAGSENFTVPDFPDESEKKEKETENSVKELRNRKQKKASEESVRSQEHETAPVRQPERSRPRGKYAAATTHGVVYVEDYEDDYGYGYDSEERSGKKKPIAGIIAIVLLAAVIVLLIYSFRKLTKDMLGSDKVFQGITLNGEDVSGMTEDELKTYIRAKYVAPLDESEIIIAISGGEPAFYKSKDLLILPDADKTASQIYSTGRSGNKISDLFTVYRLKETSRDYTISFSVNNEKIREIIGALKDRYSRACVQPSYKIEAQRIVFTYGVTGLELKDTDLIEKVDAYIEDLSVKLTNGEKTEARFYINVEPQTTDFHKIQKVNILTDFKQATYDAKFTKTSAKEYNISPEQQGYAFDDALLDEILLKINNGEPTEIAEEVLELTAPDVIFTRDIYRRTLFRDRLGTSYNTYNGTITTEEDRSNREKNVAKAAEMLNGIILDKGESLNFLSALGTITETAGYTYAIEPFEGCYEATLGGGISRVATALYCAAISSQLDVRKHTNSPVAPLFGTIGYDAFVSAESRTDLVIVNTTEAPVKIEAQYKNGTVTISILGTVYNRSDFPSTNEEDIPVKLNTGKTIKLSSQIARTTKYKTVETEDPSLPEGTENIVQHGANGYTVNLYMLVNSDDPANAEFVNYMEYEVRNELVSVGPSAPVYQDDPADETPAYNPEVNDAA